jgi:glycine cleavage system regulatory protein
MAHLGGKFAGIVQVAVPADQRAALEQDLQSLAEHGLNVHLEPASDPVEGSAQPPDTLPQTPLPTALLEVVGGDRPGIVRELSSVLAAAGVNVEQLETEYTPAPMTGGALFRATVHFCLPEELTIDQIRKKVEAVAGDLMVDISDSAEKSQ